MEKEMNKPSIPMPSPTDRETALFSLAIVKPAAERAGFLDAVCGADKSLRQRRRRKRRSSGHEANP